MQFLEELDDGFGANGADDFLEFDSLFAKRAARGAVDDEEERPEAIEARGYRRGFAEGEAQTAERYAALLRERETEFEARLGEERVRLTEALAERTTRLIQDEIHRCESVIGEQVAMLLMPLLETQLVEQSLNEIRDLVRRLLIETPDAHLKISGPADLIEAMRTALGENGLHASVQETRDLEIRVEVDQVVVESRVRKWIERLREVMQ